MIESDPVITVETSCGETIKHRPSEMTDWQLTGLLKQNSPRTDVDQTLISAMRDELFRRVFQPMDETWINHEPLEGPAEGASPCRPCVPALALGNRNGHVGGRGAKAQGQPFGQHF
jgi:hypothetical protein